MWKIKQSQPASWLKLILPRGRPLKMQKKKQKKNVSSSIACDPQQMPMTDI